MDHDRRRDLNALGGLPATPVHQVPSRPQAYRFGAGVGDETFQLANRDWRKATDPQLGQLHHFLRFVQRLRGFSAMNHADGLTGHAPSLARLSTALRGGAAFTRVACWCGYQEVGCYHGVELYPTPARRFNHETVTTSPKMGGM